MKRLLHHCISFILCLAGVVLYSCTNTGVKHSFTEFNQTFHLKPEIIVLSEVYNRGLFHFYDSLYILANTSKSPYQIHLYNEDFRYISSSGLVGRGPGEISHPFFAQLDSMNGILWFMDMGKRALLKFPIDSILRNPEYLPTEQIPLSEEVFMILQYYPLQNGLFSFSDVKNEDVLVSFFNDRGEIVDSLNVLKDVNLEGLNNPHREHITSTFVYNHHPKDDLIVIAFRFSDIVAIINSKGELIALSQGPLNINQIPDPTDVSQKDCYISVACCDENYIYLPFNGKPPLNYEIMRVNSPEFIHVFDWSGKPVARFILDHPIGSFSLDKKNKRLISFSMSSGEVVIYNIPKELYEYKSHQ